MIRMNAYKVNAMIFVLLAVSFVMAQTPAIPNEAVNREESRHAEIANTKVNPVSFARPTDLQARQRFLEIERIARLPENEQRAQLSRLYQDLAPRYMSPFITGIISSYRSNILENKGFAGPGEEHLGSWSSQLSDAAKRLTPEEVADKIGSGMWLNVAARVRSIQVFKEQTNQLTALIDSDLDSGQADRIDRAALTILAVELKSYSMRLLEMFLSESANLKTTEPSNRSISSPVGRTLLFLHDPAIIPVLREKVEQHPQLLVHVSGLFQHSLYQQPADPMLLALVSSRDREVSYHAAYSLAECQDVRLAPLAAAFAVDKESRFRWLAGHWSVSLPRETFLSIRASLLPLLKDEKEDVFDQALRCFAKHKDHEAGKVILEMLKKEKISSQLEVTVMQCLSEMAGTQFGYFMHTWGPGKGKNTEAIEKFENWLVLCQH